MTPFADYPLSFGYCEEFNRRAKHRTTNAKGSKQVDRALRELVEAALSYRQKTRQPV